MERYAKYAGTVAAGALILFFLIGVVSGVPVFSAILRAVLSGFIVGAGIFGVFVIAERMLPGLVPENGSSDGDDEADHSADDEPAPGSRLNIVVDDDSGIEDVPEEAAEADGPEPSIVDDAEAESEDEETLVEEVQEQTAENADEIMQAVIQEEQDGIEVAGDRSEFDDMPDIGAFAGSFVSSDYSESEDGGYGVSRNGPMTDDAGNDPAQIARAIRTLLNKDEHT